jgi:hypothetical protein
MRDPIGHVRKLRATTAAAAARSAACEVTRDVVRGPEGVRDQRQCRVTVDMIGNRVLRVDVKPR